MRPADDITICEVRARDIRIWHQYFQGDKKLKNWFFIMSTQTLQKYILHINGFVSFCRLEYKKHGDVT